MQTPDLGSIVADVLQRSATSEEIAALQAELAGGTAVDALVRRLILGPDPQFPSGECIETVFPVIRFYQGVYGRLPDKEGLAYWVGAYRAIRSLDDPTTPTQNEALVALARPFVDPIQTPEFADRYGPAPGMFSGEAWETYVREFVGKLYLNVLQRAADAGGLAYWTAQFQAKFIEVQNAFALMGRSAGEAALETRAIYLEQFTNSQEMVDSAKIPILNFLTSAAQDPDPPGLYSGSLFNDPPAFTGAVAIGVIEGGSVTLTEAMVPVFDPDNGSQDIRFTISNLATGSLLLNNQPTLTFTKQQLANGQVRFQHDGSEQPSLNFTISVEDLDEEESPPALASAVITVAPVNDAPVLTGAMTADIPNGGSYVLKTSDLGFSDPDDAPGGVTFTVSGVVGGELRVNGVAALSFTGEQLEAGLVSFATQAGMPGRSASMLIALDDGNEDNSAPATAGFTFHIDEHTDEEGSPLSLSLQHPSATTFAPLIAPITIAASNGLLPADKSRIFVWINDILLASDKLNVSPDRTTLAISQELQNGLNTLQIVGDDDADLQFARQYDVWAGGSPLAITVRNSSGALIPNATVEVKLTDDLSVAAIAQTNAQGIATFANVPSRSLIIQGSTGDGLLGTAGVLGGTQLSYQMTLQGFGTPSSISNNEFLLGTEGWEIGSAPVTIIDASGPVATIPSFLSSPLLIPDDPRGTGAVRPAPHLLPASDGGVPMAALTLGPPDKILRLSTSGEGLQSISRTFIPEPDVSTVVVRYKFVTSEVPGGYFGTKYNDYYSLTLRSHAGQVKIDSNSMNNLGLAAFDANGATAWRELALPVNPNGDTVQIIAGVANIGDGSYDSQLLIDYVKEKNFSIESVKLKDIDDVDLKFLSVGDSNPYFHGINPIHGTITLKGKATTKLSSLELEIIQDGEVVAKAGLHSDAAAILIGQEFGSDKTLAITLSDNLFDLPVSEAEKVDDSANGKLTLRVVAQSTDGETVQKDYETPVQILTRFTDSNRYGQRDEGRGGDDWALPFTVELAEHFTSVTYGDFSNINAGSFKPDHETHENGRHLDGWFDGYNARNGATADKMIDYLNDPDYGSHIKTVYVTFSKSGGNTSFWNAIKDVELDDGRMAKDVILPLSNHDTHFHWIIY